jgi:hypothetical protein
MKGFTGCRNFLPSGIAKVVQFCRLSPCPPACAKLAVAIRQTPDALCPVRRIKTQWRIRIEAKDRFKLLMPAQYGKGKFFPAVIRSSCPAIRQ